MKGIKLEILAPGNVLVSEMVDSVRLPGKGGSFEVLQGHAPIISSLGPGEIIYAAGGEKKSLGISSGFVQVRGDEVSACVEV